MVERTHRGRPPVAAKLRFAAGLVVDAGVNDAAVVPGLVRRQLALLLDDGESQAGLAQEELIGGGEPHDPTADDRRSIDNSSALHGADSRRDVYSA